MKNCKVLVFDDDQSDDRYIWIKQSILVYLLSSSIIQTFALQRSELQDIEPICINGNFLPENAPWKIIRYITKIFNSFITASCDNQIHIMSLLENVRKATYC